MRVDADFTRFFEAGGPISGLPSSAYTSEAFWEAECETLFRRTWVFAGFRQELKKTGDVVPVSVAGQPVLLVRARDGGTSAFHNVCRHRCMTLVTEPKNVGRIITCPYHAWAYGLDGSLRSTPNVGGPGNHHADGISAETHSLVPIRTAVWQDWIFVNLDGNAPDFEDYAAPLIARLQGIDFDKLEPIGVLDFGEVKTNWKFVMENFIEPYHVPVVHSTTTEQPLGDHYTILDAPVLGSAVDLPAEKGGTEKGGAESLSVSSRYLTLFPNFILGRYVPDQMGVYLNIPVGPNRMIQKRALYMTEGERPSDDEIKAIQELWWAVHKEDHEMCERLQAGRASDVAQSGGVLSPHWENSVRAFQEMVASNVMDGAPQDASNERNLT